MLFLNLLLVAASVAAQTPTGIPSAAPTGFHGLTSASTPTSEPSMTPTTTPTFAPTMEFTFFPTTASTNTATSASTQSSIAELSIAPTNQASTGLTELAATPTGTPSRAPTESIDGREQGYLWGILILIISGPSVLSLLLENVLKPWRNAIHDKAFVAYQMMFDGKGYDWIDRETDLEISYSTYLFRALKYTYYGLPAFIFPDGVTVRGFRVFEKGAFEDFLRYVMNEEEFFSMFFADDCHPFSRTARRLFFPALHGNMLLFYALAALSKAEGSSSSYYALTFFLIIPSQWILSLILRASLTCACCMSYKTLRNSCLYFTFGAALLLALFQFLWIAMYISMFATYGFTYHIALRYTAAYFSNVMVVSTTLSLFRIFICFFAYPLIRGRRFIYALPLSWNTMRDMALEAGNSNDVEKAFE